MCAAVTSCTELLELPSSACLLQTAKINIQGTNYYLTVVMSMSLYDHAIREI